MDQQAEEWDEQDLTYAGELLESGGAPSKNSLTNI